MTERGMVGNSDRLKAALRDLSRPLTELVEDAHRLGWTVQLSKAGILALHSPGQYDDHESIILPRNEKNVRDHVLKTWHRKLRTYAMKDRLTPEDEPYTKGELPDKPPERPIRVKPNPSQLPTPKDVAKLREHYDTTDTSAVLATAEKIDVRVVDRATGQEVPDPGPVNPANSRPNPIMHEGRVQWLCYDCPPGTWFPDRYSYAGHQGAHVKRPVRRLKCRLKGCEEVFVGPTAAWARGQHEVRKHKKAIREGIVTTVATGKALDPAEALDMVVETLREAGVIGETAQVAELTKKLEEVTAERDAAREELATIKKVFKSFAE